MIGPDIISDAIAKTFNLELKPIQYPAISGYTTTYNPKGRYPWKETITSLLGFCDLM